MAGEQQGEEEEALAGAPAGARGARAEEGEVTWHLHIILFVVCEADLYILMLSVSQSVSLLVTLVQKGLKMAL